MYVCIYTGITFIYDILRNNFFLLANNFYVKIAS